MNQSSDAAEQIVKMSLEGFQVALKVSGSGAKNVAVFLYALAKNKEKIKGKTTLTNMLKSGKPLKVFSIREQDFKKFTEEAKRYGILYTALLKKNAKAKDGVVDVLVRAEDASKINRIVDRFNLFAYDSASIKKDIENTRRLKKQKSNPSLAKTEKSPLSEPTYRKNPSLKKGTIDKESVKQKLEEYRRIIRNKEQKMQSMNKNVQKTKQTKSKGR